MCFFTSYASFSRNILGREKPGVNTRHLDAVYLAWSVSNLVWNFFLLRILDYKMIWDPKEYGNITSVQMPNSALWRPDILLFNRFRITFHFLTRNPKSSISKSRCEENIDLRVGYLTIHCFAFILISNSPR